MTNNRTIEGLCAYAGQSKENQAVGLFAVQFECLSFAIRHSIIAVNFCVLDTILC